MTEHLYEPTPSKRLRSYDAYSSSPSFSELSCHEEKSAYSLRRKRVPLTPIKERLRQRALVDYSHETETEAQQSLNSTKIEKRVTRSSYAENNEAKTAFPLIPLGSNLIVSIVDSDSTRGMCELLIHILIDHNLSVPSRTDIITPNFSIIGTKTRKVFKTEDTSDESFLIRHKKKELFEKKAKNRAKEIYRYEMHSKMLRQESQTSIASKSSGISLATENYIETDEAWYKKFLENKDQPLFRVGVFTGQELWRIDQDQLEDLIRSKEIQSDYLPANTPVDMNSDIVQNTCKRSRSTRKKVSK